MVLDDGYAWNGCVYRSLSQVAKAITGTNWNGHRFFGLKAVRNGASNRKRSATPRPNPLLDIGMSPTLAGFAPAMPDRSPPLATKGSDSTSPNESARRPELRGRAQGPSGRPAQGPAFRPQRVPATSSSRPGGPTMKRDERHPRQPVRSSSPRYRPPVSEGMDRRHAIIPVPFQGGDRRAESAA